MTNQSQGLIWCDYIPIIRPSTWLPHPAHPREIYYSNHKKCPLCGGEDNCQTLMGFTFDMDNPDEHRDENHVACKCGWNGIVHNLT